MKNIVLGVMFLFILSSCSTNSSEDISINSKVILNYNYSSEEIELTKLINEYRVSIGKNTLEIVSKKKTMFRFDS